MKIREVLKCPSSKRLAVLFSCAGMRPICHATSPAGRRRRPCLPQSSAHLCRGRPKQIISALIDCGRFFTCAEVFAPCKQRLVEASIIN